MIRRAAALASRKWAQREAGDVGEEPHPIGLGERSGRIGDQRLTFGDY
jgi:hypothetical protein